jgi:hypothetical protein
MQAGLERLTPRQVEKLDRVLSGRCTPKTSFVLPKAVEKA